MTGPENTPDEALTADTDSVQIVKGGEVGEDELAALVAGIVAASAAAPDADEEESGTNSRWARGGRRRETFPRHGRDVWRWSLR